MKYVFSLLFFTSAYKLFLRDGSLPIGKPRKEDFFLFACVQIPKLFFVSMIFLRFCYIQNDGVLMTWNFIAHKFTLPMWNFHLTVRAWVDRLNHSWGLFLSDTGPGLYIPKLILLRLGYCWILLPLFWTFPFLLKQDKSSWLHDGCLESLQLMKFHQRAKNDTWIYCYVGLAHTGKEPERSFSLLNPYNVHVDTAMHISTIVQ